MRSRAAARRARYCSFPIEADSATTRSETERLLLRPFATADVDALHAMWVLPEVRRYLWDDIVIERSTAASVVEASGLSFAEQGYGLCRVERRDDDALVGFCGLRDYDDPGGGTRPELLYGLAPDHWHLGYAFESAVAVLRFGFEQCGLDRIDGGIDPPNERSRRVLERLGMHDWRRLEINGLPADFSQLLPSDFWTAEHRAAQYQLVA